MASSSTEPLDRDLTNEELIQTRPNRRVIRVETYNSYNKKGKPFQVLFKDETLSHKGATPVTIYEGVWWYLKKGSSKTEFALSEPVPSLHDFDLTIEASDVDAPVQTHTPDDPQSPETAYAPGDDLQLLKKLSQCLAILQRLSCRKSNKLYNNMKITYIILCYLGFRISFISCN